MTRTIDDTLTDGEGNALGDVNITFKARGTAHDSGTIPRTNAVTTTTDSNTGAFTITLENGEYQVYADISGTEVYLGIATIEDGADTDLATVLGASAVVTSEVRAAIDAAARLQTVPISGNAHTVRPQDLGKVLEFNTADPVTLTLPQKSTADMIEGDAGFFRNRKSGKISVATEGSDTQEGAGSETNDATLLSSYYLADNSGPRRWVTVGDLTTP